MAPPKSGRVQEGHLIQVAFQLVVHFCEVPIVVRGIPREHQAQRQPCEVAQPPLCAKFHSPLQRREFTSASGEVAQTPCLDFVCNVV